MTRPTIPTLVALCAVTSLLALPAAAQTGGCATAANLSSGINLDFSDGITEVYRRLSPGIASVTGLEGAEQIYRLEIAQGTHLLDYIEVSGGQPVEASHQVYDYGMAPQSLPVPTPGQRFNPVVQVTASDGVRTEAQAQAYVETDPIVLGACTYRAIEAVIAYDTPDNYIESITYLPDLEIGFLHWSQTDEGRAVDHEVVGIRTGK